MSGGAFCLVSETNGTVKKIPAQFLQLFLAAARSADCNPQFPCCFTTAILSDQKICQAGKASVMLLDVVEEVIAYTLIMIRLIVI